MKLKYLKGIALAGVICAFLHPRCADAQTYVRCVEQYELTSKTAHADSVLQFVPMPRGVAKLDNYPKINVAALELSSVLKQPGRELLEVWVRGSASPEGSWEENVRLSRERTDEAVAYISDIMDIPDYVINAESLNEDWYTLYRLVEQNDVPRRYDVLFIIRTMQGEQRKQALKALDDGKVWSFMQRELFPQLRGVRFAFFCSNGPAIGRRAAVKDTVYVRDTVVIMKEVVYMNADVTSAPSVESAEPARPRPQPRPVRQKKVWDTPWLAAVKTDIATDVLALPQAGFEVQLSDRLSFEMTGWYSEWPYINPCGDHKVYGFRPELRYWIKGSMRSGLFFGLHSNLAWYAMMVNEDDFYQNASLCTSASCTRRHFYQYSYQNEEGDPVTNIYHDTPAWSVGMTVGYSLPLDRKMRWTVEFVAGAGYAHYEQNLYQKSSPWTLKTVEQPQVRDYFGITRASVNLTYRFSLRRFEEQ